MARTARHGKLDTRSARAKLAIRREPYWATVQTGLAVGYRRIDLNRGTWIARAYDKDTRTRRYQALGDADDTAEADGQKVLDFGQAQAAARSWHPRAFARYANAKIANIAKKAGDSVSGDDAGSQIAESPEKGTIFLSSYLKLSFFLSIIKMGISVFASSKSSFISSFFTLKQPPEKREMIFAPPG